MQTRILAALLCGCALTSAAVAETIVVNDEVQVRDSQLDRPKRGLTMDEVEKHFGAPVNRHPAVGRHLSPCAGSTPSRSRSAPFRLLCG